MKTLPQPSFSKALESAVNRILEINGRSRRSEFWWPMALVFVLSLVIPYIGFILNVLTVPLIFRRLHDTGRSGWWWGLGVLLKGACLIFLFREIAGLILESQTADEHAVDVLWHLIAQCGLWLAVIAIYQVVMIVFLCMDSEKHENKYGPSPKYVDEEPSEDAEDGSSESY